MEYWAIGDPRALGASLLPAAARLVAAASVRAGEDALDLGCGTGSAAILAARRGARACAVDVTRALLPIAREEAAIAGAPLALAAADAQALPYRDASFDVALSSFALIYAEDRERAVDEVARVLKPGGRLAFTTWSDGGFHGEIDAVFSKHMPPTSRARTTEWGDAGYAKRMLARRFADVHVEREVLERPALSPRHYWQRAIRESPALLAVAHHLAEDEAAADVFRAEFLAVVARHQTDGAVRQEYLLVRATRP